MTSDFARIIPTTKYGEVVVIDDIGDISPDDAGHIHVYVGSSRGTTMVGIPRPAFQLTAPFTSADPDPQEVQDILDSLDRRVTHGAMAQICQDAELKPIAKIFRSEKYGQIIAVLNGDMDNKRPHIMVQFRPTRPTNIRAISLICASEQQPDVITEALPTTEQLTAGMAYMLELRFERLDLEQIETCVQGWINNYPATKVPPLTFT